jgi:predicted Zn-ribbon and HTH transcriptional regulator
MRTPVKCNNCGIKWERVAMYPPLEWDGDLQYNCPKCGSNWYETLTETDITTKPEGSNETI